MGIAIVFGLLAASAAFGLARSKGQTPAECAMWALLAFGIGAGADSGD